MRKQRMGCVKIRRKERGIQWRVYLFKEVLPTEPFRGPTFLRSQGLNPAPQSNRLETLPKESDVIQ